MNNIQHLGTGLLSFSFDRMGFKWYQSDLMAMGLGLLWEIKDSVVDWEKVGYWGGEGFSVMDLKTDFAGVVINRALSYGFSKVIKNKINFTIRIMK